MKPKYIQALGGAMVFAGSFMTWEIVSGPYSLLGSQIFAGLPMLFGGPLIVLAAPVASKAPGARGSWLAALLGLLAFVYMGIYAYGVVESNCTVGVGAWVCLLGGLLAFAGGWMKNPSATPQPPQPPTPSPQAQASDALLDQGGTEKDAVSTEDVNMPDHPAVTTVICPQCGAENRGDALNCIACRVNLAFAQEHPNEVKLAQAVGERMSTNQSSRPNGPLVVFLIALFGILVFGLYILQGLSRMGDFPVVTPAPRDATAAAQMRETRVAAAKAVAPSLVRETGVITSPFRQGNYTSDAHIYLDRTRLWVDYANQLLALDPESREVVLGPIEFDTDATNMVSDGKQLWVSRRHGSNPIPIDMVTGEPGPAIEVAVADDSLVYDGNRLWFYASHLVGSNVLRYSVQAIDPISRQVSPPVETWTFIDGLVVDQARQVLWILNSDGKVQQYDLRQNALRDTPLQFPYYPPWRQFHFDGQRLWTISDRGNVQSIDVDTGKITDLVSSVTTVISSILSGEQLWIGNDDWTVQSIDLTTGRLGPAIPVGGYPRELEFDGQRLWIVLYDEGRHFVGLQYLVPGKPTQAAAPAAPVTEAPVPSEAKKPVLRVNLGGYPEVIDPQKSSSRNEIATLRMVYEGLTKLDSSLETVPGAAKSWEYNSDATELTFQLRPGLKYSDGTVLNARRFEYAIVRNIDPETAGGYGTVTNEILGAEEWQAADTTAANYDRQRYVDALGVKALDANGQPCRNYAQEDCRTLQLKFRRPAAYFHVVMGIWVAYPAKEENITAGGENWWNSAQYQVGNGPFSLKVVEPDIRQHMVPNPYYWDDQPAYDLEYRYIADSAAAFEAFKNNELDVIDLSYLPVETLNTIRTTPSLWALTRIYPSACTSVIKYTLAGEYTTPSGATYESPFLDKKVREAFSYAFDAAGWSQAVDNGLSIPTQTWIPPGVPGYEQGDQRYAFDLGKAKAALAESSFKGPAGLNELGLKLTFSDSRLNRQYYEWLVKSYKQNLGVDIALDPVESSVFDALIDDPKTYPLLRREGWCGDYPDPQNWLSVYWKSNTTFARHQGYHNPAFDKLVEQADAETNWAKRLGLYRQAQKILLQDVPAAFGHNRANAYLVKPWVKGIMPTSQDADWPGSMVPESITIDTSMLPQ
jgi:oligopeptide transport system substrate-binding protein